MALAKKSLGQHWLNDQATLNYIVKSADLSADDTVLEVGPGTGSLTAVLLRTGAYVIAVEKDEALAARLPKSPRLKVFADDILKFNLSELPAAYKVAANIPYYLTSHLLRRLASAQNPPSRMVLLVQKEVAERLCAPPGQTSLLSITAQFFYDCRLGKVIPAELFRPPPKVDSQVVILDKKMSENDIDSQKLFRLAKAGFGERRKKLRSSISGGLRMTKTEAEALLDKAGIDSNLRAQDLSIEQWLQLYRVSELGL